MLGEGYGIEFLAAGVEHTSRKQLGYEGYFCCSYCFKWPCDSALQG